jgi:hypothetical protein
VISHRIWKARRVEFGTTRDCWLREGWFLFGIIPLFIRDLEAREKF